MECSELYLLPSVKLPCLEWSNYEYIVLVPSVLLTLYALFLCAKPKPANKQKVVKVYQKGTAKSFGHVKIMSQTWVK